MHENLEFFTYRAYSSYIHEGDFIFSIFCKSLILCFESSLVPSLRKSWAELRVLALLVKLHAKALSKFRAKLPTELRVEVLTKLRIKVSMRLRAKSSTWRCLSHEKIWWSFAWRALHKDVYEALHDDVDKSGPLNEIRNAKTHVMSV